MSTILQIVQAACPKLGLPRMAQVYGSQDQRSYEMAAHCNDVASKLFKRHDWQKLKTIGAITGDGTSTAFDLPSDYDRMLVDGSIHSSAYAGPFEHIVDMDLWLEREVSSFDTINPSWIMYGGQLHLKPVLDAGITAKFVYISNLWNDPIVGEANLFTADDDVYRLDQEMLRMQIIWRWKAQHGMPYMEDMEEAEDYTERLMTAESGPKVIRTTQPRLPADASLAYPFSIVP